MADLKRIMIQERGEDEYYYVYNKKYKAISEVIEDDFLRQDLLT